jgi:hypothetical protein
VDKHRRRAQTALKTMRAHEFDQRARWLAKVRNVSRLGSQIASHSFHYALGRAKELNRLYSGSNPRWPLGKDTGSSASSDPGSRSQPQDRPDLSIAMKANFWVGAHAGRNERNR